MTKIHNEPADFKDDQLAGFAQLYRDRLWQVPGGIVGFSSGDPQVAVIVGGGSGHYPAFCGLVGPGFASGAVVGNIFTSPSAAQVYSVAKAANQGRGVILTFGNYAGDNMNFGIAAKRLNREGIDTRIVVVTDDIASASDPVKRRGIAGDFTVFKVMGAAAAAGLSIDEVEALGQRANDATRTLGVAFSGCYMPGAREPLFEVPDGHMGLGLGIHGEPGIRDILLQPADALADMLIEALLKERPLASDRAAVIVNGLGSTKYEELFLLWGLVQKRLEAAGVTIVDPEVGELVTSLDMGGCSVTLMWLDEDLERYWKADAYTPAYRKQSLPLVGLSGPVGDSAAGLAQELRNFPPASAASEKLAAFLRGGLQRVCDTLVETEDQLGRMDAIAGDGDHGRGMVKGAKAALAAAQKCPDSAGAAGLLVLAGQAWAAEAGGTSGVLWGAGLEAAGNSLDNTKAEYGVDDVLRALEEFEEAIRELGGAALGDKTLLDSLIPFVDAFRFNRASGLRPAWAAAAAAADKAAQETANLRPKRGRAVPLAERSLGTPDPGAVSLALVFASLPAAKDS